MTDIVCYICKGAFDSSHFNKDKHGKNGLSRSCKSCAREKNRKYYQKNKEKVNARNLASYYANHEERKAKCLEYYYNNKEVVFKNCAKRRSSKQQAMPPWLDKRHEDRIRSIYKACINTSERTGIDHHVDHIVPLQSDTVCGLHVWWNLRIIPAKMNLSKGNRVWPNMWGK